jgi:ectoine hydroxylase-related dioxygenase (phytanoyl-CoA dioxygenase family)
LPEIRSGSRLFPNIDQRTGTPSTVLGIGKMREMSSARRRFFETNGFIAIPDLVPVQEITAIRRTLLALYAANTGFDEGAQFDALGSDEANEPKRFPQILLPSNYVPALRKTEYYRRATILARELLGPEARLVSDIAMMNPAGSGAATPWHQDEAFLDPNFEYRQINIWLALQDTDQRNGCMEFLPGSNHGPIMRHAPPGNDTRKHALECVEAFDRSKIVPCPLSAGSCTVHTAQTLHGTGPNLSDQPRMAYVLVFDIVPLPRTAPRSFPWQQLQTTPRAEREQTWRRAGGLWIYLWRRRSRLRLSNPSYMLRALIRATKSLPR